MSVLQLNRNVRKDRGDRMDNVVTSDLSQFGLIELEEAGRLLSHVKEIDAGDGLHVEFNRNSGNVFLVDEDYRVWMMNEDEIEEWFYCPYCGHEGFKEDMKHEPQDNKIKTAPNTLNK